MAKIAGFRKGGESSFLQIQVQHDYWGRGSGNQYASSAAAALGGLRDKNGNTSQLWNTTAFSAGIVKIELVYSSTKDTYANENAVIFRFGNAADSLTYETKLSTEAGVKTYTITPDVSNTEDKNGK